nr:hypothetical protein CFP56_10367 [Quercus suber]
MTASRPRVRRVPATQSVVRYSCTDMHVLRPQAPGPMLAGCASRVLSPDRQQGSGDWGTRLCVCPPLSLPAFRLARCPPRKVYRVGSMTVKETRWLDSFELGGTDDDAPITATIVLDMTLCTATHAPRRSQGFDTQIATGESLGASRAIAQLETWSGKMVSAQIAACSVHRHQTPTDLHLTRVTLHQNLQATVTGPSWRWDRDSVRQRQVASQALCNVSLSTIIMIIVVHVDWL